jgi:hypothetical protein
VTQHAERLGVTDDLRRISASQREKLAEVTWDEPFRRIVGAIAGVKVPAIELRDLLRDISSATGEAAQIELVEAAATSWRPTGPARRVTRNKKAQQMRMVLGQMFNTNPDDVIDSTKMAEDLAMWERANEYVQRVLAEYKRIGIPQELA